MNTVVNLDEFRRSQTQVAPITTGSKPFQVAPIAANSLIISEPSWEASVEQQFRRLARLEPGWDGAKAQKLDLFTATYAMRLLHYILPHDAKAPTLSPLCYGGLQFEWFNDRIEFEIEVVRQYQVRVWLHDIVGGEESETTFEYDLSELIKMTNRALGSEADGGNATAVA
jgi:hypothetical protein